MNQHLSLYELNQLVQGVIEHSLQQQHWVEAEVASARDSRGHLYLELVQKDEDNNALLAKASAKCWANTWMPLRSKFLRVTGENVAAGMKLLMRVYAQFHPSFGFSWIITDIDPTYTLGDMAQRRMEIIRQLKEEGVFDLQRQLALPMFCQSIAVISSATAAGYGDFCNQLEDNEYGFRFATRLFPAVMQGDQVEPSVIEALDKIYEAVSEGEHYDCVVIIRGGGATSDMSGFDTLLLAENVANYPIPIITGIGHDRDECILDLVAHTHVKTPTAVAAFLVSHLAEVSALLDDYSQYIQRYVSQRVERERMRIAYAESRIPALLSLVCERQMSRVDTLSRRVTSALGNVTLTQQHRLQMLAQRLPMAVNQCIQKEEHRYEMLKQRVKANDPQLILQRGYSMTMAGGKVVTDASQVMNGEIIETRLSNGNIISKVWKP